ncbi:GlsB/YeaQ/YmgE family stress response membrane protein [Chlorogloeopsis fritschii PCC 9212]|uniref:Uncharacterized protein n=1 Tax=Chlorogloeopsis fritschii PCC 6912 TaxID=211165 RepID=A0A3S1ALS3_CHLFR|nr:GlsB/YeaQ/YmgE family stress response membrane protein [Chlorogloeopsis fritschii]MBF2004758.1 hypothetical protein [Chlorogloeopsis fritschii C42_A2020_084]RUR84141.1 hypothetical protein PCC6912_17350 [Chlorogloeopsis fritschii PCC 6912]
MSLPLLIFWALVGFCPQPPLMPSRVSTSATIEHIPWWRWWTSKIIGIVGGILGGWLFVRVWPVVAVMSSIDVAATAVGAFIGAVVLMHIYEIATEMVGGRPRTVIQH